MNVHKPVEQVSPQGDIKMTGICRLLLLLYLLASILPVQAQSERPVITLENVANLTKLAELAGHSGGVYGLAFNMAGTLLASAGGRDQTARLWDMNTGQTQTILQINTNSVNNVAFSPDGLLLASIDGKAKVQLWDPLTGNEVATLAQEAGGVGLAFSPDGQLLASTDVAGHVYLWSVETHEQMRAFLTQDDVPQNLAFAPDGSVLAAAGVDGVIYLWDVKTGEQKMSWEADPAGIGGLTFSPDGSSLASGGWSNTLEVWDGDSGEEIARLEGHTGAIEHVAYSPDGTLLASASDNGEVYIRDSTTNEILHTFECFFPAIFSPDGRLLVCGDVNNTIELWGIATEDSLFPPTSTPSVEADVTTTAPIESGSQGVTPSAGHWEGINPFVSFDVSTSNQIINFEIRVPVLNDICFINADVVPIENGGFLISGNGSVIIGTFDSSTTLNGTYQLFMCGNTMYFNAAEQIWMATISD